MLLKQSFKLQKLQIHVYGNRLRIGLPQKTLTVMFNPASIAARHENTFSSYQGINSSSRAATYIRSTPLTIALDLVLDSTGVDDFGIAQLPGGGTRDVAARVTAFLAACFDLDGDIHQPKFLKIQWGNAELKNFDCRLQAVDVEYAAFDRSGAPLHATLKTVFVEDLEPAKRLRKERKSSPDLAHTRIVKSGDTLPLLAKEVYGSAHYYLRVAQANNLDDFRDLTPGQSIDFPPLDKTA